MLRAKCLTCGAGIKTHHDHLAGAIVGCPKCGGMVELPASAASKGTESPSQRVASEASSPASASAKVPAPSLNEPLDPSHELTEGGAAAGQSVADAAGVPVSAGRPRGRMLFSPFVLLALTTLLLVSFLAFCTLYLRGFVWRQPIQVADGMVSGAPPTSAPDRETDSKEESSVSAELGSPSESSLTHSADGSTSPDGTTLSDGATLSDSSTLPNDSPSISESSNETLSSATQGETAKKQAKDESGEAGDENSDANKQAQGPLTSESVQTDSAEKEGGVPSSPSGVASEKDQPEGNTTPANSAVREASSGESEAVSSPDETPTEKAVAALKDRDSQKVLETDGSKAKGDAQGHSKADLKAALAMPIAGLTCHQIPLYDFAQDLDDVTMLPVSLDLPALQALPSGVETPLSIQAHRTTLQGILSLLKDNYAVLAQPTDQALTLTYNEEKPLAIPLSAGMSAELRTSWLALAEAAAAAAERHHAPSRSGDKQKEPSVRIEEDRLIVSGPLHQKAALWRVLAAKLHQESQAKQVSSSERAVASAANRATGNAKAKAIVLNFPPGARLGPALRVLSEELAPTRVVVDWRSLPPRPSVLSERLAMSQVSERQAVQNVAKTLGGSVFLWDQNTYWIVGPARQDRLLRLVWRSEGCVGESLWSSLAPDGDELLLIALHPLSKNGDDGPHDPSF